MEKRDGTKVIALVVLIVAVVVWSVGFATFSATLNITNASAVVEASDEFSANVHYDTTFTPICYLPSDTNTDITVYTDSPYSHGTATQHSWANIKVPITTTNRTVICKARVINESIYAATLTEITSHSTFLTATTGTGSDAATNMTAVLQNTTVTVTIGAAPNVGTITYNAAAAVTSGLNNVIQPNATTDVLLTIEYAAAGPAPDGDVTINIPLVDFTYESTAPSS